MFHHSQSTLAAAALMGLLCTALPAQANLPFYTFAYAGLDLDSDEIIDVEVENSTFAQLGNPGGSNAYAKTSFGQNQAYAEAVSPTGGPQQIGAMSVWSDLFTITGGAGSGNAQVSARITGSFADTHYSAASYALIKTEDPLHPGDLFDFAASGIPPLGSNLVMFGFGDSDSDAGPVNVLLTGSFDFTYDQDFFLTSVLVVGASDVGTADFGHSAQFGITLMDAGTLSTGSGTSYVAAVPEPETWAMLLAGLGLVGLRLRRR